MGPDESNSKHHPLWSEASDLGSPNRVDALTQLYKELWKDGRRIEAIEAGLQIIELLKVDVADRDYLSITFELAMLLTEEERYEESEALIDATLALPVFASDSVGIGFLYWQKDSNLTRLGTRNERILTLQRAATSFADAEYEAEAAVRITLAGLLQEAGLLAAAVKEFRRAIDVAESNGEPAVVCRAKSQSAEVLLILDNYDEARTQAEAAAHIAQFLSLDAESQQLDCLLGRLASAQGFADAAIEHFDEAIQQRTTAEHQKIAAEACYYKAVHLRSVGDRSGATELFEAVSPILKSLGNAELASDAAAAAAAANQIHTS